MSSNTNQLALAMDIGLSCNFEQLFGATCAETFSETVKANNPYHYLCSFLFGIWFVPSANRQAWAQQVLTTIGKEQQGFMHHAKEAAEILSSDNFRKSLSEAMDKTNHKFAYSFVHILTKDFMHFAHLEAIPSWDSKLHAKAVAHFLGFALMLWANHPAVATAYAIKFASDTYA